MYSGTIPQSIEVTEQRERVMTVARPVEVAAPESWTPPGRMFGIDLARFLAALAIVLYHTPRSAGLVKDVSMIGRFSTPLFSLLAAFFLVRHFRLKGAATAAPYLGLRARRLLIPFAAWSVIYLGARVINLAMFGTVSDLSWVFDMSAALWRSPDVSTFLDFMSANRGWTLLWAGTDYHLWFLPFLFTVSVLAVPMLLMTLGHRRREIGLALGLITAGLFLSLTFDHRMLPAGLRFHETLTFPGLLYFRSSSFLWGLAIGLLCASGRAPRLGRRGVMVLGCVALACLSVYVLDFRRERMTSSVGAVMPSGTIVLVRLAAACLLFVAFANWRGGIVRRIGSLGGYGLGIYLSHVLVIEFLHALRRSRGVEAAWWSDLIVFAIAFPASFAIAWLLARSRRTKWLVG